jgi:hypothetical protein
MRRSTLLVWAAVIVPLWTLLFLCVRWEPVLHDGWDSLHWHTLIGLSWHNLLDFARDAHVHGNPRLGEIVMLLLFTPGPWHVIVTPVLELATFYLLVALLLGRWPRSSDDACVYLAAFAIAAITAPQFGVMLFYRPFTGNYVFGLCMSLGFLLPYRFGRAGWWIVPLGFATGMCNEHTGPAVLAFALVLTLARARRPIAWRLAGLAAMLAGGLALFFAPGEQVRYNGLGRDSLIERVTARGFSGDLLILTRALRYIAPALLWLAVAAAIRWIVARRAARAARAARADAARGSAPVAGAPTAFPIEIAMIATAFAIVLTLLVSPKLGPRLYLAPCALVAAAVAHLVVRWARWPTTALSAAIVVWMASSCVPVYRAAGALWAARVASWQRSPTTVDPPYVHRPRSRWILDDDVQIPWVPGAAAEIFSRPRR